MVKPSGYLWLVFYAVITLSSPAWASGIFVEVDSSAPWHVTQKSEYVEETDVDSQNGNFSVGKSSLSFKKEYKYSNGLPVDLTFSIDHYVIHDDTAVDLPASLQSKGVMVGTKLPMPFVKNKRFFIGVDSGAYFQSAKDHGFDSSTFRSKSRVFGIYKQGEFVFVAGVRIQPEYEENGMMPFVGFQYILNDQWSFHFLSNEPYIAYHLNDRVTLMCKTGGYFDEFEVAEGGRKGEIVKVTEAHAGLGVAYEAGDNVSVEADIGWAFARKYEYLKNGGKITPDDGLYAGVTFKLKF